jgi:ERCC4-type nuclease
MSIVVTPGETALLDAFAKAGIDVITENLLVGDAHIRKGDQTVYIFERKAKGDLDASIKDGRYREQKSRLLETGVPRQNIVYVIEQLSKPRSNPAYKRVWSAICNSQHRDGFTVFQTKTAADTVDYLVGMARSVEQFTSIKDSNTTDEVNVNIKKRQVARQDWFRYALTLIPKCSLSIAEVITGEYPTMTALITAIEKDGEVCLANLKHGTSQRRIGNKLSTEICETVLNNY